MTVVVCWVGITGAVVSVVTERVVVVVVGGGLPQAVNALMAAAKVKHAVKPAASRPEFFVRTILKPFFIVYLVQIKPQLRRDVPNKTFRGVEPAGVDGQ